MGLSLGLTRGYNNKFSHLVLAYLSPTCYNGGMKEISYTIFNPWSGDIIMSRIPSDQVEAMTRYFAWLTGVRPSTMVVKETNEKPLTRAAK